MDTTGAGFAEAVEQAQALGLRRGRPDRRRRGLRRRGQGRDPRLASPSTPGSRGADVLPRGHHRGHRRRRRRRPARWTASSSCSRSASGRRRRRATAVSVRVHPAMIPRTPPAGRRPRGVQRRLRRGRRGRRADVLRPRRRRRPDRLAPCSATSSPWRGTGSAAAAGRGSRPTPTCRSCAMGEVADAVPHQPRRRGPPGRARPGRDGVRRARRVDRDGAPAAASRRRRRSGDRRASLVVVTHTAHRRGPLGHRRRPRAPCDVVRGVDSVMRVEGA